MSSTIRVGDIIKDCDNDYLYIYKIEDGVLHIYYTKDLELLERSIREKCYDEITNEPFTITDITRQLEQGIAMFVERIKPKIDNWEEIL